MHPSQALDPLHRVAAGEQPSPPAHPPLAKIKIALQVSGLLGGGEASRSGLRHLARLRSRFNALKALIPNLGRTLDFLLLAGSCQTRSPNGHELAFASEIPLSKPGVANLGEWLLLHEPPSMTPAEENLWLDILAIRWLVAAAFRIFGDQIPYGRESWEPPSKDFRDLKVKKMLPKLSDGALQIGYPTWLALVSEYSQNCQLPRLVNSLLTVKEVCFHNPRPPSPRPLPRLSERHLLKSHWLFPSPYEHQKLVSLLNHELNPSDLYKKIQQKIERTGEHPTDEALAKSLQTWHRCEAALVALSVLTCRPIRSILTWRVQIASPTSHRSDSIQISYDVSRSSGEKYAKLTWVKNQVGADGVTAAVELPYDVQQWLKSIHPGVGSPTLNQLLPYSLKAWDERAYEYLAQELGCTARRAQIICRDLVSRLLYDATANAALVRFWRSGSSSKLERSDRLALGHYLQPQGNRARESFTAACSQALGPSIFPGGKFTVLLSGASYTLTSEELILIKESLEKKHHSANGPLAQHNALAHLTLFICLLATGHRRSTTPFPFPWDFSPCERLVFICDKLVTGSEARFASLPCTPLSYLRAYAKSLQRISRLPKISGATKLYAEQTAALLSFEEAPPSAAKRLDFQPLAGVFFLLDESGEIPRRTLTTNALDLHIESLTKIQSPTKRLRATMAQYLWENGCSGRLVQAFLGHQPELHVHGPASTWSVHNVAHQLAPLVESFFKKTLGCTSASIATYFPSPYFPSPNTAPYQRGSEVHAPGYEGRKREKSWSQYRARSAIRQEIAASLLSHPDESDSPEERFGPKDRQQLEDRILEELWNDLPAQKRVSSLLDEQLAQMRLTSGKESHRTQHPDLSAPGPIEVGFSRLLRCAHVFRSVWERSVGVPLGNSNFDKLEALAHLAISLICFDGVISKDNVRNLVGAAANSDFEVHRGTITLRCNVVTATHDFEFSVRPGAISTALVLGIDSRSDSSTFEWHEVEQRASQILRKLMNLADGQRWTVARLGLMFRPYWLLRLPGAMYSVATGEQKGPAADAQSEAMLHGKRPIQLDSSLEALRHPLTTLDEDHKGALQALKNLFRQARGVREKGEQRRRVQRAKLRVAIHTESSSEMLRWSSSTQIFYLLLTFIDRLLEIGGRRVKSLAFTSIEKYFSWVAEELILQAWDFDFETCDADNLKELFDSVAAKVDPGYGRAVLHDFAAHLRDSISVPHFGRKWEKARTPVRSRTSLVLPLQVERALALLCERTDIHSRHAAVLIAACAGYGLRRTEALGLTTHQFDDVQNLHLSIKRSGIADLKTHWGRRVIPSPLLQDGAKEVLTGANNLARTSPRNPQYLFESELRDFHITSAASVVSAATLALRAATGNPRIVLHHLRHSFGTLLGLAVLAPPKSTDRYLNRIVTRLLGTRYVDDTGAILQCPAGWPFGIDALANTLGHADVRTFLDTYFHASHLVIADRSEPWQPVEMQQERLARLLGVERTKITKLKMKLASKLDNAKVPLDVLVQEIARRQEGVTDAEDANASDSRSQHAEQWALIFRAMQYRLNNDLSMAEMWAYAAKHLGYSSDHISTYRRRYEALVQESGLDDFEPDSSELITPVASHRVGVIRGSVEREDFVARVQRWAEATPENRATLERLLEVWLSRVSPSSPKIVCRTSEEIHVMLKCLSQLGATSSQLKLQLHGDLATAWLVDVHEHNPSATWSSARASRGSPRVKVPEVSIAIDQVQGSQIPDGRDFHRSLIGLYLVCGTDTYPRCWRRLNLDSVCRSNFDRGRVASIC